jgi:hypothetical protein
MSRSKVADRVRYVRAFEKGYVMILVDDRLYAYL